MTQTPLPKQPRKRGEAGYRQSTVSMSSGELKEQMNELQMPPEDQERGKLIRKQRAEQKQNDEKEQKLIPEQRRCIGSVEIAY